MSPRSLAFREFEVRHRGEADVYWRLAASAAFAERWWASIPAQERPRFISDAALDPMSAEARVASQESGVTTVQLGRVTFIIDFLLRS